MKNLFLLLWLSLCCSTGLFSQSKSSLELIAGIDHTYRVLNGSGGTSELIVSSRNRNEKPGANVRVGFNNIYHINSRVALKTGLRYAQVGYVVSQEDSLRWPSQHNGNGGFDPNLPGEGNSSKIYFKHNFIEMPLVLRYYFTSTGTAKAKKISTYVEAGIAPSLYLSTRTVTKVDDEKSSIREKDPKVKKLHWVAQCAVGFAWRFPNSDQLFGQPTARFHVNKTVDAPVKEHLYSFGLEVGYRKCLK